jgi:hypothetical protein
MIAVFRTFFSRWFRPVPHLNQASARESAPELAQPFLIDYPEEAATSHPVPYDENLLEKSRTQWQFGDWESLAKLERDTLRHHPDRAKLALLAAAGHLQTDHPAQARQYIRLAQDWGCSKKLVTRILAAGVHNSLGRAAARQVISRALYNTLRALSSSARRGPIRGCLHRHGSASSSCNLACPAARP